MLDERTKFVEFLEGYGDGGIEGRGYGLRVGLMMYWVLRMVVAVYLSLALMAALVWRLNLNLKSPTMRPSSLRYSAAAACTLAV